MPLAPHNTLPGISALTTTTEKEIQFSKVGERFFHPNIFLAAAVDAGNTPTTTLRAGLVLGRVTATKLLTAWNPDGTDGSEWIAGILMEDQNMLDVSAVAQIVGGPPVLAGGCVKAAQLLIEGTAFTSSAAQYHARALMRTRFVFDDDLIQQTPPWVMSRELIVTAATLTVTAAMNGTRFVSSGGSGSAYTLPTPTDGLTYEFLNVDDQTMSIASAGSADDILTVNDAGADSLTFSTGSSLIGAYVRLRYSGVMAKWVVEKLCSNTMTIA